ncbi:MAG: hypothetical protein AB1938_27900 [Myxococcota bacterium]
MNVQATKLELSGEELTVLVAHLKRHLDQVDKELVRTDNPRLQHAIAHEVKVLEGVVARLEADQ